MIVMFCAVMPGTLKMEAMCSSETLVTIYKNTRCQNPKYHNPKTLIFGLDLQLNLLNTTRSVILAIKHMIMICSCSVYFIRSLSRTWKLGKNMQT